MAPPTLNLHDHAQPAPRLDPWAAPPAASDPALRTPTAPREARSTLRLLIVLADELALAPALALGLAPVGPAGTLARAAWAGGLLLAWLLVLRLHGLHHFDVRRLRHSTSDELGRLFSAALSGAVGIACLEGLVFDATPSLYSTVLAAAIAFVLCLLFRGALRTLWVRTAGREPTLLVGSGDLAVAAARRLAVHPEHRARVVGHVTGGRRAPSALLTERFGAPWLGGVESLPELARERGLSRVLVVDELLSPEELERLLEESHAAGLSITMVPSRSALIGPTCELDRIGELPTLELGHGEAPATSTLFAKRALDLTVATLGLVLLGLPALALALLIKLDSPGPAFFRQARIGRSGRRFTMYKFRTMSVGAEQRLGELIDLANLPEPMFKIRDDPRVTRIGRWLRRTSLDELPQLLNVLRAEMSLVGPRPDEEAVVARYSDAARAVRLAVKPGLTGPMQVYGRGDLSFEERMTLERDYVAHLSLATDLSLLARTPRAVLLGAGAY